MSPRTPRFTRAFLALASLALAAAPALARNGAEVTRSHGISPAVVAADPPAVIKAQSTTTYICPANLCVTLPVTISRSGTTPILGFSVTIQLSANLTLCSGLGSITEGGFMSSGGGTTSFQKIDNGGGSYTVDDAVLDICGPNATSGTLFNVAVTSSSPAATGSITVTAVQLRDCNNMPLAANPGSPGTVPIDTQNPTVTVVIPNGGEVWPIGSSQKIRWNASDNVSIPAVDIAYSTDGGATFPNVIATGVPNNGSYPWTVANTPTTQARLRVTVHDQGCGIANDISDANFTIRNPIITATAGPHGSITPNGAVSVPYDGTQNFNVVPDNCYHIDKVLVDGNPIVTPPSGSLSLHYEHVTSDHSIQATFAINSSSTTLASDSNPAKFGTKVTFKATVSPSGSTGTVEFRDGATSLGTAPVVGGMATLSVTGLSLGHHLITARYSGDDCHGASQSTALDQVVTDQNPPTVHLDQPNGGDTFIVGQVIKIGWTASDDVGVDHFDLYVSRDNGNTYTKIISGLPNNPPTYQWTATGPGTNDAQNLYINFFKVVAFDAARNMAMDASDAGTEIVDGATAALLSLFQAEPGPDGIELRWQLSEAGQFEDVSLERAQAEDGPWAAVTADRHMEGDVAVAVDRHTEAGTTYFYRLTGTPVGGGRVTLGQISATAARATTEFGLSRIAPNPTHAMASIDYTVAREARVRLTITDVQGREIARLVNGTLRPGHYEAVWTGQAENRPVSAGLYFVRYQAMGKTMIRRLVVMP